ncbi:thiamine diphosphokinase [Roseovarius nitratireducens]|uniref:thiamine diphosphokinase n=1 Tax=Roseovarius nitratireducens TaxID=2044597 RepID=UPI000CE231FD|nr:thiamine diphosphokinase [Roseovarius nitratireducens]
MIVREKEAITLIGGAHVARSDLDAALSLAPVVVAADGGADKALEAGLMPRAVIGDFDSISAATRARLPDDILHPLHDQDSTDFDKCLAHIDAPLILGLGFTGDRLDHQMAACNALVRHAGRRCVLLGAHDLMFLCPPVLDLPLEPGCRVSLFPMGAVEGASDGLEWPIGGINFAPDGRVGTSNRTVGPLNLSVTAPKMLVMLPGNMLETVARALMSATATWEPT